MREFRIVLKSFGSQNCAIFVPTTCLEEDIQHVGRFEGSSTRRGNYTKLQPTVQYNGTSRVAHTHIRVQTSTDG